MTSNRVIRSLLLATGVLLAGGCASRPEGSLLETKFQRAASTYDYALPYKGTTVFCNRGATRSLPLENCVTEAQLRAQVEDAHRSHRAVARGGPQYVATVPGRVGN
jgi:hypothetical protein